MRVLVVGDVHTKTWILDSVEKIMHNYDRVVLIGDYFDDFGVHASKSIETLEKVRYLVNSGAVALLGNHEYHYISDNKYSGYDESTQRLLDERANLKQFVTNLPISVVYDGVAYSHAGFVEEWDPESGLGNEYSPIWSRPGRVTYETSYKQVVGHTPVSTVSKLDDNVWGIDTFSTNRYGNPIGDGTVLEVIDGEEFRVMKLEDLVMEGLQ